MAIEKQTIISKGKYTHRQPEQLIFLKQYMYVRGETGTKHLLLRFVNERNEPCNAFSFVLSQLDAKGAVIKEECFESNHLRAVGKSFVFEQTITVEERCTDFRLRILRATFGDYTYHVEEAGVLVTYEKAKQLSYEVPSAREGVTRSVRPTAAKRHWMHAGVALVVMLLLFAVSAFLIYNFAAERSSFSLSGVKYEFVTAADGSKAVEITGYSGIMGALLLPNEIEGYPVLGIREGAFAGNSRVRRVRVEGLNVPKNAFQNCRALAEVELVGVVSIGENAFFDCDRLSSVSIMGVEHIGVRAFANCDLLGAVSISHEDDTKILVLGEYAFAECGNLSEVTISQWILYPAVQNVFSGDTAMRKLHLRNFAYTLPGVQQPAQSGNLISLFETSGFVSMNRLTEVSIDYMDSIPSGFCRGFQALKTLRIGKSEITQISDYAFEGCHELATLSLPVPVKTVGEKAFSYTALTSFNGSALTSIGAFAFEGCAALTDVGITAEQELTSIGRRAFAGCTALKSIVIPKSVTALNEETFLNCAALGTVDIAADALITAIPPYCFAQCAALRSISLPASVTQIKLAAFMGCTSLLRLDAAGSITSYGERSFSGCSSLTVWPMPTTLTEIGDQAFSATAATVVVVPDSVRTIGFGAFAKCGKLTELTVPFLGASPDEENKRLSYIFGASTVDQVGMVPTTLSTVTLRGNYSSLPAYAFYGCEGLSVLNVMQPIQTIGQYAFSGCKNLAVFDFSNITTIGEGAFFASGLKSVMLPEGFQMIPANAFAQCNALTSVTLPQSLTTLGMGSFANCTALEEIVLPTSLSGVSGSAFSGCTKLARVTLPNTITLIEYAAFADCTALTGITLPTSLQHIGGEAFARSGLTSIVIVPSVSLIEKGAFAGCAALTDITVPFVGSSVFSDSYLGALFGTANSELPQNLKKVTVAGANNYTVPTGAFAECRTIEKIVLGEGVIEIGQGSFTQCNKLSFLSLPQSLKVISDASNTFLDCYRLYELENLSGINLVGHGSSISKYALDIRTVAGDSAPRLTVGEFTFACYVDQWYLVDYNESLTELRLPNKLSYAGAEHIWVIPSYLCYLDQKLQSVTVSSAVLSIGDYAFFNTQLNTLDLSSAASLQKIGDYAFSNTQLSALDLTCATSLQTINQGTFRSCSQLSVVKLSTTLREIGDEAFVDCAHLYDVYYTGDALSLTLGSRENGAVVCYAVALHRDMNEKLSAVATLQNNTITLRYWNNVGLITQYSGNATVLELTNLQSGITDLRIVEYAFAYNSDLQKLVLGNEVTSVQRGAFYNCPNLREVIIKSEQLKTVEESTFAECHALRSVTLPSSVTAIKWAAFQNCNILESVTMPSKLEKIEGYAFNGCRKLLSITIPANVTEIGEYAFSGCEQLFEVYDLSTVLILTKGSLENGSVAQNAKAVYTSTKQQLDRVERDGFLFVKGDNAWYLYSYSGTGASSPLAIPATGAGVTVLYGALHDLAVTSIILPNTIKYIEDGAFYNMNALTTVYYGGDQTEWSMIEGADRLAAYTVYYYDKCVHESGRWTYDANNAVTTAKCALTWTVTTQPTCNSAGVKTGSCNCGNCSYSEKESVDQLVHSYADGFCKYCREKEPNSEAPEQGNPNETPIT